jgi:hypothetical protein
VLANLSRREINHLSCSQIVFTRRRDVKKPDVFARYFPPFATGLSLGVGLKPIYGGLLNVALLAIAAYSAYRLFK